MWHLRWLTQISQSPESLFTSAVIYKDKVRMGGKIEVELLKAKY